MTNQRRASYVLNSADGRASPEVDSAFDLSEDSTVDHLDIGIDHLVRGLSTDGAVAEGQYALYLAITDGDTFTGAQCWKVPSAVRVEAPSSPVGIASYRPTTRSSLAWPTAVSPRSLRCGSMPSLG